MHLFFVVRAGLIVTLLLPSRRASISLLAFDGSIPV